MANVILVRVSTQFQADSGVGISAQLDTCKEFAASQGIEDCEVITEAGVSGGLEVDERPELIKAINLLGRGDALIVYRLDRIARNAMTAAIVDRLVAKKGARILSADGVGNDASPEASLMKGIVLAFSIYERSLAKVRCQSASKALRKSGKRFSRKAPWGWAYVGDEMVECESEQAAIAMALDLRSKGHTFKSVSNMLFEKGHTNRQGNKFSLSHLQVSLKRYKEAA